MSILNANMSIFKGLYSSTQSSGEDIFDKTPASLLTSSSLHDGDVRAECGPLVGAGGTGHFDTVLRSTLFRHQCPLKSAGITGEVVRYDERYIVLSSLGILVHLILTAFHPGYLQGPPHEAVFIPGACLRAEVELEDPFLHMRHLGLHQHLLSSNVLRKLPHFLGTLICRFQLMAAAWGRTDEELSPAARPNSQEE